MGTTWLELTTDEQVWNYAHSKTMKNRQALHLGEGEFWADTIKRLKDQPEKRLELAIQNLPLPAAFREAKIALRALIRAKRKDNQDYEVELCKLYRLAAIESFSVPNCERLQIPGYQIIRHTPGGMLSQLPFSYPQLGYEKLDVAKTDVKWFVEHWGEPENHSTLHDDFNELWREYEDKFSAGFERKKAELTQMPGFESLKIPTPNNSNSQNTRAILFILFVILGLLILYFS